ncbi:MAG TPA: hypothetical protein VD913_06055 [bacterium]|nr:hypothetical protein [bacterium]
MSKVQYLLWSVLIFLAFQSSAFAGMGESVGMIGEGTVELPVSVVKLVGGTLKLVGELLILPFTAF